MKKIAIIGTGVMGAGMAANFLKKGYEVLVWNRTPGKLKDLVDSGAVSVLTPREAAQKADIVFEMTADDASSRSVWFGDEGIIAGAKKDSVLIASSTLSASWIDELANHCMHKKLAFFDMPVTGGRTGAENGKLIMLAGGDKVKLKALNKVLSAISEKVFYFGPTGSGARFKLLLNMMQGIHVVVFAEVFKMAKAANMDLNAVGEALAERLGGTTAMAWKDYGKKKDNFKVSLIAKDLRYAKEFADTVPTPMLDEALKRYGQEIENGYGSEDWTIITK